MPPVAPDTKFLNGHLYSLFRKEFVSSYQHPLCSDAYSSFIRVDPLQVCFFFESFLISFFFSFFFLISFFYY